MSHHSRSVAVVGGGVDIRSHRSSVVEVVLEYGWHEVAQIRFEAWFEFHALQVCGVSGSDPGFVSGLLGWLSDLAHLDDCIASIARFVAVGCVGIVAEA